MLAIAAKEGREVEMWRLYGALTMEVCYLLKSAKSSHEVQLGNPSFQPSLLPELPVTSQCCLGLRLQTAAPALFASRVAEV